MAKQPGVTCVSDNAKAPSSKDLLPMKVYEQSVSVSDDDPLAEFYEQARKDSEEGLNVSIDLYDSKHLLKRAKD